MSSGRLAMWTAALRLGAACLRREPVLGIKRLLLPVSYWRVAEFAYVWKRLAGFRGACVLDLGSPKDLAAILARDRGCAVTAVDILPEAIALSERYARAQGLDGYGAAKVRSEVQDGRALSYADGTFDAAYSVSVIEHIPHRGDTATMQELVRVVKPGGLVVVTIPYDRVYRETFVQDSVYERKQVGSDPVFFERHYDEAALADRLLSPIAAEIVDRETWGERGLRVESLMLRAGPLRLPLSPLEPVLSLLFLHRLQPNGTGHPMAVFFTVRKRI
jgi:SAM-dependent methyltransferase